MLLKKIQKWVEIQPTLKIINSVKAPDMGVSDILLTRRDLNSLLILLKSMKREWEENINLLRSVIASTKCEISEC